MSSPSQLIQPLICPKAISTLSTIVPGVETGVNAGRDTQSRNHASEISQYRQVLLTSLPLLLADFLALGSCLFIGSCVAYLIIGREPSISGIWNNLAAVCVCHLIAGSFLNLFPASGINPVRELRNQLTSIGGSFLVLIALNGLIGEISPHEGPTFGVALLLSVLIAPSARFSARKVFGPLRWWGERVIVVGNGRQGQLVLEFLERQPQRGLKPLGMVDDTPNDVAVEPAGSRFHHLGKTADLVSICREMGCHWVIAAVSDKDETAVRQILTQGSLIPNLVVLNSSLMMPSMWVDSFDAAGLSGIHVRDRLLCPAQRIAKRIFDVVLASLILIACAPLLALIGLWIKMISPGPVFFRHHGRVGRDGVRFAAFKIRTMAVNAEELLRDYLDANPEAKREWDRDLKLKNDPRIIPGIGNFLRKTSLDELPQLLNVLTGEMSLVGPRPIYTDIEIEKFQEMYPLYLRVRPGLTGLWQVSGRNNTSYEDRVRLDTYYVRNWSLWLDYFILLRTVRTVLLREGSY